MALPVAIYRDILLPASETFIRAQAESLRNFVPYYFGSRSDPGLELPRERVYVLNSGDIEGRGREAMFKLLGHAPQLQASIAKRKPVLIHAHFGSGGALILSLARRAALPLIVTFHGSDASMTDECASRSHYSQSLYLRRRKQLIDYGTVFLAVSSFIKQKLIDRGFPEERSLVHPIGIDLEFFRRPSDAQCEPMVLFVGRLEADKGCEYLIRAMAVVQRRLPSAELAVVGAGPEKDRLERLAQETGCRCSFLGRRTPSEVRDLLIRAQVFCVPSITQPSGIAEGFGLVFAESQAMGVPVVSFRTGGIPEAVEDGVTGFLGPEKDWEFLTQHIELLLRNSELRKRFARSGVARVREKFDIVRQTAVLEDIYRHVALNHEPIRDPEVFRVLGRK